MRAAALLATMMLVAGCGPAASPAGAVVSASPTATGTPLAASPSASPAPTTLCSQSNRCYALVTLRGSNTVVVRDLTDIAHPKTIGTIGALPEIFGIGPSLEGSKGQFLSQTRVAFVGGNPGDYYGLPVNLYSAPVTGGAKSTLVSAADGVIVFAWSPDGSRLIYLTPRGFDAVEMHERRGAVDRVLANLPRIPVGGVEAGPVPTAFQTPGDKWDYRLSFSADGSHISVVQEGIDSYFRVFTADGQLLSSSDAPGQTMSIWSGSALYFRDAKGVEVWRDGGVSLFLPGVQWIRPKASAGGGHIVYEARDASGSAHVFVVDTASGRSIDLGGKGRAEPAFLTDRYVWYQAEPACVAAQTCEPLFPGVATGQTYIYDLSDQTESSSVITSVLDVWPHAA